MLGAPQGAAGGTWKCWGHPRVPGGGDLGMLGVVSGAPKGAAGGTWGLWGHPRVLRVLEGYRTMPASSQ